MRLKTLGITLITAVCAIFLMISATANDVIPLADIPDENLRVAINKMLDKPTDALIDQSEILNLTQLNVEDIHISTLIGLEDAANGTDAEKPIHTVYVDAFYMDTYEVTNAQYKQFVDANPEWQKGRIPDAYHHSNYLIGWNGSNYPPGKANYPVIGVSWYAAMAYSKWTEKRLPTEAEWEKAARGGLVGQKYPRGNTITVRDAHYGRNVGPIPVGLYPANAYGLHDMEGNVSEWCLDAYNSDFYSTVPPEGMARNPLAGDQSLQWVFENYTKVSLTRFPNLASLECLRNCKIYHK